MDISDESGTCGGGGGGGNNDDIESAGFLEKFGCMQTYDHDDLICQMLRLIGDSKMTDVATAKFYLEMNMWNVQAAVCSYFDLQQGVKLPAMTFIKDVTIGEGESVPPGAVFIKTWKVHNTGADRWPDGSTLKFTSGTQLACQPHDVIVNSLLPWQMADISVEMRAPDAPGIYESKWRMSTPTGAFFGDPIFVIITVEPGGTLALTQQMSNFHSLGQDAHNPHANPFASSTTPSSTTPSSSSQDQDMEDS